MARRQLKHKARKRSIGWFRKHPPWGTVYLMRSLDEPRLFKIGFTARRAKDRKAELERISGERLMVVYAVTMPNAYRTEQLALLRTRNRMFRRGDRRGIEWFWLRRWESIDQVAKDIAYTAGLVRLISKLKGSWRAPHQLKIFDPNRGNDQRANRGKGAEHG